MFRDLSNIEYVNQGHMGCPGCGAALSMRHALKVLGEKTICVIPACCFSIISGIFPASALAVPLLHVPFATAAACASGVSRALKAKGDTETTVMVWAGDGGTFDIGLQALSGAADRREDFLYVCYDNEAYMNTGIQQSSATPPYAWTTTTVKGKQEIFPKKDIISIVMAHNPSYVATATIAYPEDFINKFKKAKEKRGFRFIHILSSCPPGWRMDSKDSIKALRLAVQTDFFPLLESTEDGRLVRTVEIKEPLDIREYFKVQKRFVNISHEDIIKIRALIGRRNKRYFS